MATADEVLSQLQINFCYRGPKKERTARQFNFGLGSKRKERYQNSYWRAIVVCLGNVSMLGAGLFFLSLKCSLGAGTTLPVRRP